MADFFAESSWPFLGTELGCAALCYVPLLNFNGFHSISLRNWFHDSRIFSQISFLFPFSSTHLAPTSWVRSADFKFAFLGQTARNPVPYPAACSFLQQRHSILKFATEWGIMMILEKKNPNPTQLYCSESFIFKSLKATAEICKLHLFYYSCCKYIQGSYNEWICF